MALTIPGKSNPTNPHPQKREQGWSAHLNQHSRICHSYHKLLRIPARVHKKEQNRGPTPCNPQCNQQGFYTQLDQPHLQKV